MNAGSKGRAEKKSHRQPRPRKGRGVRTDGTERAGSSVGKWKYRVPDVAKEYLTLGLEDEKAGRVLMESGQPRQAIYFFVQAMEKFVLFGVFSEVCGSDTSADGQTYRERTVTHDLDELLGVLLEVYTEAINDSRVSGQIEEQLSTHVLEGEQFNHLHNNIRYPRYMWKSGDFAVLQVCDGDVQKLLKRLERLKSFIVGFGKLKGETSPLEVHMGQCDRVEVPKQASPKTEDPIRGAESPTAADKIADFRF